MTFEKKEGMVHKYDDEKHPLGEGLNKPAIVELLGIFSPNWEDPTSVKRYEERVVQHLDAKIKEKEEETVMDEGSDQRKDDLPKYSEKTLEIPMDHALDSSVGFPQKRLRLVIPPIRPSDNNKNFVMDMSVREPMQIDSFESTDPKAFLEEDTTKWNLSKEFYSHLEPEDKESDTAEMVDFSSYKSETIGSRYEYKPVLCQNDVGLLMARSFRYSWGPQRELAYCGKRIAFPNTFESNPSYAIVSIALFLKFESNSTARSDSANASAVQKEDTETLYHRNDKCPSPQFRIASSIVVTQSPQQYCDFIDQDRDSRASLSPKLKRYIMIDQECQHDAWDVETLDMMPSVDLRRIAVSIWMETAIDLLEEESCHTAELAAESGNLRLATLVAQIAPYAGLELRHLIMKQFLEWGDIESLSHFSETHALIYSVLAGAVEALTTSFN
ncbi:unnamed protein product [Albugo candida]|uniref:Peptidase S59 domain-containing protein n=1 Tax=Albugo candida TaxID=65357 RepID=A0A024FWY4_9STRA|nr:unnamed protein product [Albugo candida]|eukprot:CCI11506.1 unnamed protein product [Albugo candida]